MQQGIFIYNNKNNNNNNNKNSHNNNVSYGLTRKGTNALRPYLSPIHPAGTPPKQQRNRVRNDKREDCLKNQYIHLFLVTIKKSIIATKIKHKLQKKS